ncbi:MAG: B-box zinc finger protein [Armatimonadota bacterium]|nr:B-box zinc finger protein [Armatimonadota bacterium]MDR7467295.1 B-box zinc finger protein [Armatimonadota bacterium]MDR7494556.1 B-box zinc finger protein [Armatimonadota bacterium]MDR7504477.1 B-box zinc finger protein [Armatimonadota bacterium]MDR7548112.1 B-box zinc finger protein [Armatimonadota bacterium]
MRCARHPDVETGLTCVSCGTPICPDCMVQTPVGMKCPTCGTAPLPRIYQVGPGALAAAVVVAGALGMLAGGILFVWRLGVLAIFLGPFVGGLIGEAASRAAGWKRGRTMATAAAIACGAGIVLLGPQVAVTLAAGGTVSPGSVLALLAYRPFFLLFAALAVTAAFWRTR